MTVAAVILADPVTALADAAGRPAARRICEVAWAGGAVPIVVVSDDPDGRVAASLAGSEAALTQLAPPDAGAVTGILHGMDVAVERVSETDAVLVWPAAMAWVDAESVTSLLQAHGLAPADVLRPRWLEQLGWPLLIPIVHRVALATLPPARTPLEVPDGISASGIEVRPVDLGDPGTVSDISVSVEGLAPYEGPPGPLGGPPPEWGAATEDLAEDVALEGAALAPYGRAADDD